MIEGNQQPGNDRKDGLNQSVENYCPMLDYHRPQIDRLHQQAMPGLSFGKQMAIGFLSWVACVIVGYWLVLMSRNSSVIPVIDIPWPTFLWLLVIPFGVGVYFRVKFGWRGYLPGVLLGVGISFLIPLGIVVFFGFGW